MVGAGGIGCELLKNLVLSGFKKIVVVDLDTIDLSNLNRQFLFQHRHIGKAKAHVSGGGVRFLDLRTTGFSFINTQVARESALAFNPDVDIESHCASIYESHFDYAWFKSFDLVLNALDNLGTYSIGLNPREN
ncbi:E1 ubiquitin-activating protein uba2 [Geranomyces michiganensis]|nr:E1 ubiquitin-activating protein uba2 [Geranomyces michiganensis]